MTTRTFETITDLSTTTGGINSPEGCCRLPKIGSGPSKWQPRPAVDPVSPTLLGGSTAGGFNQLLGGKTAGR